MKNTTIYMRAALAEESEKLAAQQHFNVVENRAAIQHSSLVIPRYSALPFYKELEEDMLFMNCSLINSYRQHLYVADMQNWYEDLKEFTPKTWFRLDELPKEGSFVLKGATNSKKFNWNTHMFAKDRYQAMEVAHRLSQDSMIGSQSIYAREYVELSKLADGLNGLKITEEYRYFFLDGIVVEGGFYWSSHTDDIDPKYHFNGPPNDLLKSVSNIVTPNIRFFVADFAKTAKGDWILIELNDGQQSGLSCIPPDSFYKNLKLMLENKDRELFNEKS